MGLLRTIRKRSKRPEALTDESQRTASSWRSPFKMLHWPRTQRKQPDLELQNLDTADDDHTESCLDLFQTLMSNGVTATRPPSSELMSGNNRNISMNFWHTNDPEFLPTAYPLTRTDPRSHPQPKWGSLNLTASAALVARSLKRFDNLSQGQPRFRVGPRPPPGNDSDDARSVASSGTGRSRSAVENREPKYAFISQDGKLVERETSYWPRQQQPMLTLRYKLCEPYASNYGKNAAKRAGLCLQKFALPRARWIYERPIYCLPRGIVEDNKRRLLSRHMLKDRFEPAPCFRLPCQVILNEGEQCKRYLEYNKLMYIRETKARIGYDERAKIRTNAVA